MANLPLERRNGRGERLARVLDLPPPFRLVALREAGDAVAHAAAHAGELGAGTLVFVGRFDLAEFAVVLEPEEPLAAVRGVFYAGMVALVDGLAALAPPETPIAIEWPDALHIDGGLVGGGRLAWPAGAAEDSVPEWLVFGAAIRIVSMSRDGPGLHPLSTALADEGFGDIGADRLVEGFARHLMAALDRWQEAGFAPIAADYRARLRPERGVRRSLAPNGDLLIEHAGRPVARRQLRPALESPSWLDPRTGGPRR
jgi:biotin/lipoate A/B protein ligase family protein